MEVPASNTLTDGPDTSTFSASPDTNTDKARVSSVVSRFESYEFKASGILPAFMHMPRTNSTASSVRSGSTSSASARETNLGFYCKSAPAHVCKLLASKRCCYCCYKLEIVRSL